MSTLLHKPKSAALRKTAWAYGALAILSEIFSFVYLQFSHGESSPFLVWLFAPALLLGMVPALVLGRTSAKNRPGSATRRIWNSAIATLMAGMLVRSVINISGRYTDYDGIYWVLSGLLFAAAVYAYLRQQKTTANRAKADPIDAMLF